MTVHYLRPVVAPAPATRRVNGDGAWAALQAEFAHEAALDDAREVAAAFRQNARNVHPERLDAAIVTLQTGDPIDRWIAEQLIDERAADGTAPLIETEYLPIPDPREGMGALVWLLGSVAMFVLLVAALLVWAALARGDRPAACEFMTPSECIAWAQEQAGAR